MEEALAYLTGLPSLLVYALLGAGAAVENVLPVVPADTFIVAGGFLAGLGTVDPAAAFGVVWAFNVGAATAVYGAGRRWGPGFFRRGWGRRLLAEDQLARLASFYERWGVGAVFAARFLPGYRALVPVFAGVTGQPPGRVVAPLLAASAIWYGGLVGAGYMAGNNLDAVATAVRNMNAGLLAVAVALAVPLAVAWRRTRRRPPRGTGRGPLDSRGGSSQETGRKPSPELRRGA